jgi:hypothetical protein
MKFNSIGTLNTFRITNSTFVINIHEIDNHYNPIFLITVYIQDLTFAKLQEFVITNKL